MPGDIGYQDNTDVKTDIDADINTGAGTNASTGDDTLLDIDSDGDNQADYGIQMKDGVDLNAQVSADGGQTQLGLTANRRDQWGTSATATRSATSISIRMGTARRMPVCTSIRGRSPSCRSVRIPTAVMCRWTSTMMVTRISPIALMMTRQMAVPGPAVIMERTAMARMAATLLIPLAMPRTRV